MKRSFRKSVKVHFLTFYLRLSLHEVYLFFEDMNENK